MQSGQIYTITRIDNSKNPPRYFFREYDGTPAGWAYANELKAAPNPATHEYPFTVLKERKRGRVSEVYVKYLFYPDK